MNVAIAEAVATGRPALLDGNTEDLVLYREGTLHVVPALAAWAAGMGLTPVSVSLAAGAEVLRPPGLEIRSEIASRLGPRDDPAEGLRCLLTLLEDPAARVIAIVEYPEHLGPQHGPAAMPDQLVLVELLVRILTSPRVQASGNAVVLVARRAAVDASVRRACDAITLDPPGPDDRRVLLESLAELHDERPSDYGAVADVEGLVRVSGGLRLDDLARLSRLAAHLDVELSAGLLASRKRALIREQGEDVLEVHETPDGFDAVAGLDHMRDWAESLARSRAFPKGALFVGPPGLGKSYIVKAVAHTLALPLVSLRLVRSMWVGETERRLERALAIILALAPAVVWLDEIDTVVPARSAGASADGGTSERVTGRLLEVMGDFASNHGVLWIGTSNFVDRLDPALRSRMPAVFPFFHPTPSQIARLLPTLASQLGRTIAPDVDLLEVAVREELGFASARDLSNVVSDAGRFADDTHGSGAAIGTAELGDAVRARWRVADQVLEEHLALIGLTWCDSTARLPWRARSTNRPDAEVPPYLVPLLEDGVPVTERVDARLAQLGAARSARAASW